MNILQKTQTDQNPQIALDVERELTTSCQLEVFKASAKIIDNELTKKGYSKREIHGYLYCVLLNEIPRASHE